MDFLKHKLPGASLLESLVAMTIILLSITLSAGVYSAVSSSKMGLRALVFQDECARMAADARGNKEAEAASGKILNGFIYEMKPEPCAASGDLLQLRITVREEKDGKKVFEYNRLVAAHEHEALP